MASTEQLFDPNLRDLRQVRAERIGFADFLHQEAISLLRQRLAEVNKSFNKVLIVSRQTEIWREPFRHSIVLKDKDILGAEEGEFDLAIHALCAHSSNDPVGQFVQLRRSLKPDGLMIAVMFGGQTLSELRISLAQAEAEVRGGLSPRVSPMGEIRDLGGLIGRAGLALPVADSLTFPVSYSSPLKLMQDLRAMGETNVLSAQARGFMRRDVLARALEIYQENFSLEDGRVSATFEMVFLTGWAPSETQQQPLKPGSAKARLADALKTIEIPSGETPSGD